MKRNEMKKEIELLQKEAEYWRKAFQVAYEENMMLKSKMNLLEDIHNG